MRTTALARRNLVLDRMLTNGYITQEEHDAAQAEGIVLNTTETTVDGLEKYPYFSSYVRDLLMDPDGDYRYSEDEIFKGGLTIQTTLDVDSQEAAEAAIKEKRESSIRPSTARSWPSSPKPALLRRWWAATTGRTTS